MKKTAKMKSKFTVNPRIEAPWLLLVQMNQTPGLYAGPGTYPGPGFYHNMSTLC